MKIAQYEYSELIGKGSFGFVYKGKNAKTGEKVVVKTEPYNIEFSSIRHESVIMNMLYSKSCRSIPPTYWYGINPETRERIIVMPFYQQSVEQAILYNRVNNKNYCGNILRSAIRILGHIHSRLVVHRDIKPANWMINRDELMLIDFGMAGFYVDSNSKHLPPLPLETRKTHIIGTPKYASLNVHEGEEYARRDDLMSVVYVGLFLIHGSQLWTNCPADAVSEHEKTYLQNPLNQWFKCEKRLDNIVELSVEKWPALSEFAKLVYGLSFDETPDYEKLEELFS